MWYIIISLARWLRVCACAHVWARVSVHTLTAGGLDRTRPAAGKQKRTGAKPHGTTRMTVRAGRLPRGCGAERTHLLHQTATQALQRLSRQQPGLPHPHRPTPSPWPGISHLAHSHSLSTDEGLGAAYWETICLSSKKEESLSKNIFFSLLNCNGHPGPLRGKNCPG